jgi:hypothetical protein
MTFSRPLKSEKYATFTVQRFHDLQRLAKSPFLYGLLFTLPKKQENNINKSGCIHVKV